MTARSLHATDEVVRGFLAFTEAMVPFWGGLHRLGGEMRPDYRETYDACFGIVDDPEFTFDTIHASETVTHRFLEALIDGYNASEICTVSLRWTGGIFRKADGSYKASFWLLPSGYDRIVIEAEAADRVTAAHMAFTHVMYEFLHTVDVLVRNAYADAARARPAAPETPGEPTLADERARLTREHAEVQERRRAERAQQDAEWDAVGSEAAA